MKDWIPARRAHLKTCWQHSQTNLLVKVVSFIIAAYGILTGLIFPFVDVGNLPAWLESLPKLPLWSLPIIVLAAITHILIEGGHRSSEKERTAKGQTNAEFWRELEGRFQALAHKGLTAVYDGTKPRQWFVTGGSESLIKDFELLATLAGDQFNLSNALKASLSKEALAATGVTRWLLYLWQEGAFEKSAGERQYPSDELAKGGSIPDLAEASVRQCLRLVSPDPYSTAQDWHTVGERIAHISDEQAWVHWTKKPKDTGCRTWWMHGTQQQDLRTLMERAGQMLKKSGQNNRLSILLLTEPDALKRWCEYVCCDEDLRIDGNGFDHDERGHKVEWVGGRLLHAAKRSKVACDDIEVHLT